jgi:C-terminal peptidase prc
MPRRALLVAAVAAVALTQWSAKPQDPSKAEKIFTRIEATKGAALWDDVRDLREAARESLDAVKSGLTRADANVRIATGAALYGIDMRDEGLEAVLQIAKDSKQEGARARAAQAAVLLTERDPNLSGDQKQAYFGRFMDVAGASDEEMVKVHLLRGAYALTQNIAARRGLREIFDKPSRPAVKDEAALALASTEAFQAVRPHLRAMAAQPGENGRQARVWLKYDDLAQQREGAPQKAPTGEFALLEDIIKKLQAHYYDASLVDPKKLVEAAAKGMMGSLDPYTIYYDKKTLEQFRREEMEGHYGGIGARVQMRRNAAGVLWLTISEPIFSGPAYRHGLRSNDIITHVEGEETANRDLQEIITRLRGKPGTPAKIKVFRRGWKEAREFVITREEVQLETTMSEMLPGDIGYVNYTTFGSLEIEKELKGSNVETQIAALSDRGMKALVLDLRFNPGGYLETAEQISGMFLENEQVIVTTKSRDKAPKEYRARTEGRFQVKVPTIILVNEMSASASEILAGALQHYKRATLVGERTFGKGSVQEVKPIELPELLVLDENGQPKKDRFGRKQYSAAARITTSKWFLPSGKTVEKEKEAEAGDGPEAGKEKKETGGVDPDIKVTFPERDLWKDAEFEKLRASGKIEDYVNKEYPANKELFASLAVIDFGDVSKYPNYDAMYKDLGTRATKEEVRELVREFVRKRVQDERKRAFYMDLQLDVQLQRAILEACKATKQEAKKIKEYEHFAVGG